MLEKLVIPGIDIPTLYLAKNKSDVDLALNNGLPFIKWSRSKDDLIKCILRPVLEKMFPNIDWNAFLGRRYKIKSKVIIPDKINNDHKEIDLPNIDYSSNAEPSGTFKQDEYDKERNDEAVIPDRYQSVDHNMKMNSSMDINDYLCDISSYVNIDVLQKLKLLPAFIGDIVNCIRTNYGSVMWSEGYNKKLRNASGNFNHQNELRNLIILDISVSIPRGIAATMLNLIDTLRHQVRADLIITGNDTGFYAHEDELPDPTTAYQLYGGCNETNRFLKCMKENVVGKKWGHVIAFGDHNRPDLSYSWFSWSGTEVNALHHYHTMYDAPVGYALWAESLATKPSIIEHDSSWCTLIKE